MMQKVEFEEKEKKKGKVNMMEAAGKANKKEKKKKKKRKEKESKDDTEKLMDEAVASGDEGREVERSKLHSDDKEKKRRKKKKEKEIKGDTVAVDAEQNPVNGKKKGKENMMEAAGKADNKEKKMKRKEEKETKGDLVAGHEEQLNTMNDEKVRKKGKVNMMEAGKADKKKKKERKRKEKETEDDMVEVNMMEAGKADKKKRKRKEKETEDDMVEVNMMETGKEGNKKKKKRKEKETEDDMVEVNMMEAGKADNKKKKRRKEKETKEDMVGGHEEEQNKVKEKKLKKMDARKKRKLNKGDDDGIEVPKSKKRAKKVNFSDEVTVFPFSVDCIVNDSDKDKDGLVQGKRYSKEEDELVRKSVYYYIEGKQLGEEGLDMVLHCRDHPKIRGCWKEIASALPWRRCPSVYHRAHVLFERGERKWTPEEVKLLRESYKKHGADWKSIAAELGKFRIHVKDAFRRLGEFDRSRGHWSQEEYQTLFDQVNKDLQMKVFAEKKSKHGMLKDDIAWGAISDKVGTRDNGNCCRKWYGQLTSPMVEKKLWADVDDYLLLMELVNLDASCEEEVEWDCLLEHRPGDICRKRWNQMVLHLGEHGNKTFSEQVEVLSKRYCPDLSEVRETLDARPIVD